MNVRCEGDRESKSELSVRCEGESEGVSVRVSVRV